VTAPAVVDALSVRDTKALPVVDRNGKPRRDAELRDYEEAPVPSDLHVRFEADLAPRLRTDPYQEAAGTYMADEILPYSPDGWFELDSMRLGYSIPFEVFFFQPRARADLIEARSRTESAWKLVRELFDPGSPDV